jgi:LMBR1-like membrane protein
MDLVSETRDTLIPAWNIVYWSAFILTWFFIPIVQGYIDAGDFTFKERLKSSFRSNFRLLLIMVTLLTVFLIYVIMKSQLGWHQLLGFAICLSNTWGLMLTVMLLGYGLVELPRRLWNSGHNRKVRLKELYFQAAAVHYELDEAKDVLGDAARIVQYLNQQLDMAAHPTSADDPIGASNLKYAIGNVSNPLVLRSCLAVIRKNLPPSLGGTSKNMHDVSAGHGSSSHSSGGGPARVELTSIRLTDTDVTYQDSSDEEDDEDAHGYRDDVALTGDSSSGIPRSDTSESLWMHMEASEISIDDVEESPLAYEIKHAERLTVKDLAAVHVYVKEAVQSVKLTRHHWMELLQNVEKLERLQAAAIMSDSKTAGRSRPTSSGSLSGIAASGVAEQPSTCQVHVLPRLRRVAAVICCLLSTVLVWCEVTMFMSSINLSPLSHLIDVVKSNAGAVQFVAMVPLMYLALCAFFAMFQLRWSRFYDMQRNKRTNEFSLLLNASFLLRLMPPLAYNFLQMLRETDSAFQHALGRMDIVPFFGSSFTVYFPMIILLCCIATFFNFYGKFLRMVGASPFEYKSEFESDQIEEGRVLIRSARRRQRQNQIRAIL